MPRTTEEIISEAIALERDTLRFQGLAFPVIRVKYHGPTNYRGSRYIATLRGTRVVWSYAHEYDGSKNAAHAAYACWQRYKLAHREVYDGDEQPRVFIPGDLDADSYCYTVVPEGFLQ